jgi:two-component system, NarL family, nitrate/nitrite response regulator NarL
VIRVFLVGDDPLARSGLAALLAGETGIAIVAQAAPGDAAATAGIDADVALWDLGREARAVLDQLGAGGTGGTGSEDGPPVLALAAEEGAAAEALAAGVRGLLFRDAEPTRIAAALQAVAAGLLVLDEGLAAPLLRQPDAIGAGGAGDLDDPVEPLTPREVEVLQLLAQGLSNKLIGKRLGISEHTAKFHVNAILGKLGAQGRTDAVVKAARLGLVLL